MSRVILFIGVVIFLLAAGPRLIIFLMEDGVAFLPQTSTNPIGRPASP